VTVVITNSNFTHSKNGNGWNGGNSFALRIVTCEKALIQGCRFINNEGSIAIAFFEVHQCEVIGSVFENNFVSLQFAATNEVLVSQSNFSNHNIFAMGVIITTSSVSILDIQDCNFFDNKLQYGTVYAIATLLSVSRCVFSDNIQKQRSEDYSTSSSSSGGAAIQSTVRTYEGKAIHQSLITGMFVMYMYNREIW